MKRLLATAALVSALSITCVNLAAAQEQYLGEVRLFGFNFCPVGWLAAAGQILPINQYAALFALYGTTYGGNGTVNFALPNLAGRAPYGQGSGGAGQPIGAVYGASTTTLTAAQMPTHTHQLAGSTAADTANSPAGALLPTFAAGTHIYAASGSPANTPMAATAIGTSGGNQPFSIQSPALSLNWCVATVGIFPSRN
jgi:microcystin-dependent protein